MQPRDCGRLAQDVVPGAFSRPAPFRENEPARRGSDGNYIPLANRPHPGRSWAPAWFVASALFFLNAATLRGHGEPASHPVFILKGLGGLRGWKGSLR